MAVSMQPRDTLPGIDVAREGDPSRPQGCLSLGSRSEPNDAFPEALALDAAADGNQGSSLPRKASTRKLGLLRLRTSSNNPVRRELQEPTMKPATHQLDAQKLDAQRVVPRPPSQPASSRPTVAGAKPKERVSIARKVTRLLGLDRGVRSSCSDEGASWKPHEKMLKALGYRPKGHGRPFTEKYTLGDTLGVGGFGVVRDGTHKPDGNIFAVKVMSRDAFGDADVEALAREVDILRRLDHHQVVRFIDFYEEPQTFFLVLEKVPGGELFDRIIAEGRFREEDAKDCVRSLLEALDYCHSKKIAHRDVKPENILFASLDAKDRTIKVDCWGVGIVTHILLAGYAPFASSRMDKLFRLIKKGRVSFQEDCWNTVSQSAKDFVSALLKVDPDARPTAGHALQHSWLTEAAERTESNGQELARSLVKLKVFNAKRKFRMAIHTFIVCQKLQGQLSPTGSTDARPFSSVEKVDKFEFTNNQLGMLQAKNATGIPATHHSAQQPPRAHKKHRFFSRPNLSRKSTGIFKDKDWRTSIVNKRESSIYRGFHDKAREGVGLLDGKETKDLTELVAVRRAEEELAEDEEFHSSSGNGHG